jgi:hypothetical protein
MIDSIIYFIRNVSITVVKKLSKVFDIKKNYNLKELFIESTAQILRNGNFDKLFKTINGSNIGTLWFILVDN